MALCTRLAARGSLAALLVAALALACRKRNDDEQGAMASPGRGTVLLDCDGRADNGFETRIGTDAHCGGCDQACKAGERCVGVICLPTADVAMSRKHTCYLDRAGSVHCWGANESGEVGDGTQQMRARPVKVSGIDDAVQIAVRERQSCVRRRSGAVACWGNEFGTGSPGVSRLAPTEVEALHGATQIALSSGVFCGLMPDRTIRCTPASKDDKALPKVGPPPGEPVVDAINLAASDTELFASRRDGTVTSWNLSPHESSKPEPRQARLKGVQGALSIADAGVGFCGFRPGGRVTCWGGVAVADGSFRDVVVLGALDFSPLGGVSDITFAGWPHDGDCATRLDGETVCWPRVYVDSQKQKSQPGLEPATKPLRLPPAYRIESIGSEAYCAVTRAGELYCWGQPSFGRLGLGRPAEQPSPQPVEGVRGVREVVASDGQACARTGSGAVLCWGAGKGPHAVKAEGLDRLLSGRCASIRGELVCFDEMFDQRLPPSGLRDVVQLVPAARGSHLLSYIALHRGGTVSRVDWQRSNRGPDDGWTLERVAPVKGLSGVKELFDAEHWVCTREGNGLRCWNGLADPEPEGGQLKVATQRFKLPEGFEQLHFTRMGQGFYEACGVRGGKVACWNAELALRWAPLSEVRRYGVTPGGVQCALVADATLHCWGDGFYRMTGHGSIRGVREPQPVPGLVGVEGWSFAQQSMNGHDAIFAWLRDGRLLAWGYNALDRGPSSQGQLGWVEPPRIEQPTRVELPAR